MRPRAHDPRHLDVEAFASDAASLDGQWPLAELDRLHDVVVADVPGGDEAVRWSARGERRKPQAVQSQTWLHLEVQAAVRMTCQRCLQPVAVPVDVACSFRFVNGEDEAARLDAESDDDVLPVPPSLDLRELVEDEILLALPLVPRHAECSPPPIEAVGFEAEPEARPNPFAQLEALKRRPS